MEDGDVIEDVKSELNLNNNNITSPYESLKQSKSSIEEMVTQIVDMKKKKNASKSQLRELFTQIFLHVITLRQANRSIMIEEQKAISDTQTAKSLVDVSTLQLHTFIYEKKHYRRAINACQLFPSNYPDIEHQSATVSSNDYHRLMMESLNYELRQRKELCKLRDKLKLRKKSLVETVATRNKFLSSLPSQLKSLKKASLPVQNQLGIQHTNKLKQHQLAELLPQPLYVVYSQLLAQKEAFGENIDVEIVGSVIEAQSFARHQANNDTGAPKNTESLRSDDKAQDEDDGQRRRKRPREENIDDNAQDEEGDGQRRRKRPRKENFDQSGLCEVHPLKVILHIYDYEASDPKPTTLVTINFEYLLKLNVICAGVEGSHEGLENNILCNLFPDDTGFELPHQKKDIFGNSEKLQKVNPYFQLMSGKLIVGDALEIDEKRTSRPYKWAQHLAGIVVLPEVSPLQTIRETQNSEAAKTDDVIASLALHRQHNMAQTIVQRIRSKTIAQRTIVQLFE
ncbi:hypothetical protein ACFE04_005564 [Oxalis oulophora]